MAKSKLKVGLKFAHGGKDWTIIKIENEHPDYDTVTIQDNIGRQMDWSKGGLEYYLHEYPAVISE